MYRMYFLTAEVPWNFTVEGCRGQAATREEIGVHLLHRHIMDTIVILED